MSEAKVEKIKVTGYMRPGTLDLILPPIQEAAQKIAVVDLSWTWRKDSFNHRALRSRQGLKFKIVGSASS